MSRVLACIFDLDGVLVDTARYHYLAWKRLANELGFDLSQRDNERLKGVSRERSLEIVLKIGGLSLDSATRQGLADRKNRWYVEYISRMDETEVLHGARPFLEDLRGAGIPTALGSASRNAATIVQRTRLAGLFDALVDGTRTTRAKPDPEVFLLAAQALRVEPRHCVVFEDAAAGVEAALRAGMRCIGVGSPQALARADLVVGSLAEMTVDRLQLLVRRERDPE